jgi:hypothetical protein
MFDSFKEIPIFQKKGWKEGDYVFTSTPNGEYRDIIVGMVSGIEGSKIGISGIKIDLVGLKNKIAQGKAGPKSIEILKHPIIRELVLALIYRVEYDNFTGVFDVNTDPVIKIHKDNYTILTGWVRESIPELINNVLSLPDGPEKDQAKRIMRQRMDTLYDKDLKKYMYSVCRGLNILT